MSTHINAQRGDFSDTVLMPGDPLRAKYIAETYLDNPKQVTDVRNMLGFTGHYQGKRLSVMAHGMGIPSCSIYVHELLAEYEVKRIVRVGSCGTVHPDVKLRDVIIAMGACTDSSVNRMRFGDCDYAAIASYGLLKPLVDVAEQSAATVHVGNIFSADLFYTPKPEVFDLMEKYNVLGVEMEAASIFALAAEFNAQAAAICTVSDHIRTGEAMSAIDRQTTFDDMIKIALDAVIVDM